MTAADQPGRTWVPDPGRPPWHDPDCRCEFCGRWVQRPAQRTYVIHQSDGVTRTVLATSPSRAHPAGSPPAYIHDAKFTACDACQQVLTAEAVSG